MYSIVKCQKITIFFVANGWKLRWYYTSNAITSQCKSRSVLPVSKSFQSQHLSKNIVFLVFCHVYFSYRITLHALTWCDIVVYCCDDLLTGCFPSVHAISRTQTPVTSMRVLLRSCGRAWPSSGCARSPCLRYMVHCFILWPRWGITSDSKDCGNQAANYTGNDLAYIICELFQYLVIFFLCLLITKAH